MEFALSKRKDIPGFQKQCIECNVKTAAKKRKWAKTESGKASLKKYWTSELGRANSKRNHESEAGIARAKRYKESHPGAAAAACAKWEKSKKGKLYRKKVSKTKEHISWRRKREKKRYAEDAGYRLVKTMRARMRETLIGTRYSASFFRLTDFKDQGDFVAFLTPLAEKKGWTMEQYAKKWQVDHTIACFWYDFTNEDEIRRCWARPNLDPMTTKENQVKNMWLPDHDVLVPLRDFWPSSWKGVPPSKEEEKRARATGERVVRV